MTYSPAPVAQVGTAPVGGPLFEYSVHTADTLYDLAAQYLAAPTNWGLLQQINHVREPRRLRPGTTLRIPVALLKSPPPTARVISVTGSAEAFGNVGSLAALRPGTTLVEGAHIRTGSHSFVTVELSDGSSFTLLPGTTVWIRRLRTADAAGSINRQIELDDGEVETKVSPLKPRERYEIVTPSVIAGVRGTEFRVTYAHDTDRTQVEVLEGKVQVGSATDPGTVTPALVPRGFGVAASKGNVGSPVELLAAPVLQHPARQQDGPRIAFDLEPLPFAEKYRATIASDAGFLNILDDAQSTGTQIEFPNRANGTYFVRISAFDTNGIEGLSRTYSFRISNANANNNALAGDSESFEFRWTNDTNIDSSSGWHFILATNSQLTEPIVDQHDLAGTRLVLTNLPAAKYFWSVMGEPSNGAAPPQHPPSIRSFSVDR
ncbi:LysM peptidoglycan-binding domain-containing protein [Burkholderia sp. Bp9143]|uniref:FecR domain-containing protein n=1 Tax=Burkholderia sp. Bp9143 TaxID=2184574 RepID=UPI000F5B0703|nr:FecR domain-containing protein [Burkholderia sp. Bp9143]RQR34342.1 LysM peptidoglycan-binding domain-containing protein [Burkholderia sp. Bp9143]